MDELHRGWSKAEPAEMTIDAISQALVEIFQLRFRKEVDRLASPLMRWLDFRLRHVAPIPRTVVPSDRFPKRMPEATRQGLERLVAMFDTGEDVNPYQGRGLRLRNDTSGSKSTARTDLLFADWGIHHFHLPGPPIPAGQYFSKPSDWLAFCLVTGGQVGVVDVLPHPDRKGFANPELLATMIRSFPEYMDPYKVKGMEPETLPTTESVHALREGAGNRFFVHEGAMYMGPGGGLMSAGNSYLSMRAEMALGDCVDEIGRQLDDPNSQFRVHPKVAEISDSAFVLRVHSDGLGVYEQHSRTLFTAHSTPAPTSFHGLTGLCDLLLPAWCLPHVRAAKDRFDELYCVPAADGDSAP